MLLQTVKRQYALDTVVIQLLTTYSADCRTTCPIPAFCRPYGNGSSVIFSEAFSFQVPLYRVRYQRILPVMHRNGFLRHRYSGGCYGGNECESMNRIRIRRMKEQNNAIKKLSGGALFWKSL